MSLIDRKLPSLGRSARNERDDRIFLVASEDTYAPGQYFKQLHFQRVRVVPLPTINDNTPLPEQAERTPTSTMAAHSGSHPDAVVERLKKAYTEEQARGNVQEGDEFWVLIDTDHHFQPNHVGGTIQALKEANRQGFGVAVSNPSFALWLLLHHEEPQQGQSYANAEAVENRLRELIGSPCKRTVPPCFTVAQLPHAIRRARALETDPYHPSSLNPPNPGSRVYRLVERILKIPD